MSGSGTGTPVTGAPSTGGIVVEPTIEPISLAELKLHLRLDSGSFEDNVDETQSLAPGAYAIAANYTTHVGTGVDVLGYTSLIVLSSGTNGATGTVDVKIQESDDDVTYSDWTTSFDQVTTTNDNTIQEVAYTGVKQYIRTVAMVLLASCDFGTSVIRLTATTAEDDLLNTIIKASRIYVEDITRRQLLTATWDYALNKFPYDNAFKLPFGNLQSVTTLKYKDSDGTETTMVENTDYIVEQNGEQCGKILLPYSETWPVFTPYPSRPVVARFVCGWTAASLIPDQIKAVVKLICADLYSNREAQIVSGQIYQENKVVQRLLASYRLWDTFY